MIHTRKKKSRNYRGRKVLLPKKGNCWKLRTIDDDFSIELSIPHTTHWGYYTKKKAFFLFEESSKSMHKNHLFYPDTFGWQHTRKKYLKTSKSQRGFFFLMPLSEGKDWYTGSKGNDRTVQDNTQKHQFCWVEGGYILQQEHGNHRGTQSKKSDSNFARKHKDR